MTLSKTQIRLAALAALLAVVAVLIGIRLGGEGSSVGSAAPANPGASAVPPASAPTPAVPSAAPLAPRAPAKPEAPVYLRIDGIKLLRSTAPHVFVHLRANINAAYYDYPSADGGMGWIEVDPQMKGERFAIPRSVMYEVYFELQFRGRDRLTGAAETLGLTSPSGVLSDKLPFSEDYKLYFSGHGMKAPEPSAIVSYTITETP